MTRLGQGGDQIYRNRTQHVHQNITTEEHHQTQYEMTALQHDTANQRQTVRSSHYDRFFRNLVPLPPVPVAGGPAPKEEKVGYKERRRREKEYKRLNKDLKEEPRLLQENEVKALPLFQTRQGREKWAGEKLSHSTLTREQTMKQVLNEKDYSNFENLDLVMRNVVASRALSKFMKDYDIDEDSNPETVCARIQQSSKGVTALLDPALRLGLSLAQRTGWVTPRMQTFFRELDEAMSTAVMVSTLTHVADKNVVRDYFRNKGSADAGRDADKAVEANRGQQIQIAKRLLLMQLSDFQKITKDENDNASGTPWDKTMAVALSHCSRVALTLPKQDEATSDAAHQAEMWKAILTINGENIAQDNSRASSTHSISRRKDGDDGAPGSKEKKLPFNFIGQRGMNCAIGGLGNAGVSGKTLCNDGSCGHFYSMYKEADSKHYGAMLMGLESDANGVMNQMGHTHDIHATPEKASSLGAQRTDEVGEKYGGRQCDLSGLSAADITVWMKALESNMLRWQQGENGMSSGEAVEVMRMLAGKKLNAAGWERMRQILGVSGTVASGQ